MTPRPSRKPLPHELPTRPPPQLEQAVAIWLAEEADFRTSTSMADYRSCSACGSPIGFAETIAVPLPPTDRMPFLCWSCLVSIMLYRGLLQPADKHWPSPFMNGTFEPDFTVLEVALEGDRRPYGPSEAQIAQHARG